jgi:uncharacterized protein YerC
MRKSGVARRLERLLGEILNLENEERILREQLDVWVESRDDLKIRSLVAETPLAEAEFAEMERQVGIATRELARIDELLRTQRSEYEALMNDWNPEEDL